MHVLIVIIFKFGGISNNEQIDLYNKCHGEKKWRKDRREHWEERVAILGKVIQKSFRR